MKAPWIMVAALIVVLGLLGGVVYGCGDRSVLVPPPESVVESFVRKLRPGRHELAADHLSSDAKQRVDPQTLRRLMEALEQQIGTVHDVRCKPGWMSGGRAEAVAVLELRYQRTTSLRFGLKRERGMWRIDDLGDLAAGSAR